MKCVTTPRLKASDLPMIISANSQLRKSVQSTLRIYLFALMISGYSKSLTNIAIHFGLTVSSLSRFLANSLLGEELNFSLNRKTRRLIGAYIRTHKSVSVDIIIDATVLERSSRKAENVSLYHSCGKKVWGHRITNIGILLDGDLYVPIAALAHKTRAFAQVCGVSYLTEGMMVRRWLREHMNGWKTFLSTLSITPDQITFLLDAGYDNAGIQRDIVKGGYHFVMMVKNIRSIGGKKVKEFFARHRNLAWTSIYFNKATNGKNKRKKYRIRTAENVTLGKVGQVNAVCSEKSSGRCKSKTRRFLVSTRLDQSGRDILDHYSKRWAIETWHKNMKQNYGLNDCSCSLFRSIDNHIKLCLIAYCLHLEDPVSLPNKGVTIGDYLHFSIRQLSRKTQTLIHGANKIGEEIHICKNRIFREAA